MAEHLPECLDKDECEYDANGKCWVKHHPCICDELRACEQRVRKDQTDRCVAAFHDRISDSDLDDLISDDEKDIVAEAIRRAPQMP